MSWTRTGLRAGLTRSGAGSDWSIEQSRRAFPGQCVLCVARTNALRAPWPDGAPIGLSSVNGHRFSLPSGCSPVHIDDNKDAECTVGDADVSFRQMQRNIRHKLRDWNTAANLATNLYEHFIDAATEKRLNDERLSLFVKQSTLCIRNVEPHLVHRSGVWKVGLHKFVDASFVHISQVYQLESMTAIPLWRAHRVEDRVAVTYRHADILCLSRPGSVPEHL